MLAPAKDRAGIEGKMARFTLSAAALLTTLAATAAQAHTGIGDAHGFAHGLAHPLGGLDHVLAMVAVGLFAFYLGGAARWLVPLSFVAVMAVAGALATSGIALPWAEIGIGLSVVVLGCAVAARSRMPVAAAMALVGVLAIFHGYAHGAEMPQSVSGFAYGSGFVLATAALHAVGLGLGVAIARAGQSGETRILRATGSAMAVAGIAILAFHL
jgi:urease accessory protein